jgi:hypothetical protein
MALFDGVVQGVLETLRAIEEWITATDDPDADVTQMNDQLAQFIEDAQPIDDIAEEIVEFTVEFVVSDLQEQGRVKWENVEEDLEGIEGNAATVLGSVYAAGMALEAGTLGQVDTQGEYMPQLLAGLAVDDVVGGELEARMKEGVMPAWEQKANKEHRSKKSNFQDWVEFQLRNKDSDTGWLEFRGIDGLRPDQQEHLERAALKNLEPEELIETPVEAGIIPDEEVLQNQLDIAGLPEATKDLFVDVVDNLPRTTRIYEERTVAEELVTQIDDAVRAGEISPAEAAELIPDEISEAEAALQDRWLLMEELPQQSPSESDIIQMLTGGYRGLQETKERLDRGFLDSDKYEDLLRDEVRKDLDGDLQEAVALGIISEGRFSDLAEFAGLDDQAIEQLLQGKSYTDITERRLAEETSPSERSVRTIIGIGEARGSALQAIGIETVQDLANASQEDVAEAAQVSESTAQDFIDAAARRVGG